MMLRRTSILGGLIASTLLLAAPHAQADPAVDAAAARARSAGAAAPLIARIRERAAERNLPPETVVRALRLVEAAAAEGLPVDGVADKICEGIAKGVPPARLLPVVEETVAHLRAADAALRSVAATPAAREDLVREGADALRRGASREALAALGAEIEGSGVPDDQVRLAIRALGDLGERGAAPPMAGVALGRMAARGYASSALRSLPAQVDAALAEGAPQALLFDEIAARAEAGRPMERLVDPFSVQPGVVIRDPAGKPVAPKLPAARGKNFDAHPLGGPPGQGLDRPGLPSAPGQRKKLEEGKGPGRGKGKGLPPGRGPDGQGPPGHRRRSES